MSHSTPKSLFGPFHGHDLPFDACERLAFAKLPTRKRKPGEKREDVPKFQPVAPELMALEPALFRRKWFDYRAMHPTQATMLFMDAYNRAYRKMVLRYFDAACTSARGTRDYDLFKLSATDITGLWKARQCADGLRMPYDFFCEHALDFSLIDRGWPEIPRPIHLYSDEVKSDAVGHWNEWTRARLITARDDFYLVDNYVGSPDQDEHQQWIIDQVAKRAHPEYALGEVCFVRPMLPIDKARAAFGAEKISAARAFAASKITN